MDIYKGLTGELPSLFDYRDCRWLALNGIDYREWDLLVRLGKVVE